MNIIPKRLLCLNPDELQNRYQKHKAIKYLMIILSFIVTGIAIRAILLFYGSIDTITNSDVQFFMSLTIFIIMTLTGLIIGESFYMDSMFRQVFKNQVDIMQQLRINEHDNKLLDKVIEKLTEGNLIVSSKKMEDS